MDSLTVKLLDKSKEVFSMAIELYNKPTINYRVEGFALFICNAWELMLKAHLIQTYGADSIYYKDNRDRTLTLENCIKILFTNSKDPLRINLEKIIELRNTSTHFIVEEYEMVYVPLFQSCILNFNDKMMAFHQIDMTTIIPQNFLSLSVSMNALNDSEIVAKYPEEIATKILTAKDAIDHLSSQTNDKFAIKIEHFHYLTKDKNKATSYVNVTKNADVSVKIVRDVKDPNNTHKYTTKTCIVKIKENLTKGNIKLLYGGNSAKFTSFHFTNFCKHFGLKENDKYCYVHRQFTTPQYSYSQQAIDFIVEELKKDPDNILDNIKK